MSTAQRYTAIIAPSDMLVPAPGICPDAYFNTHAERGLVWLPERGMGWLRVTDDAEQVYDADYWNKYVGYAQTEQGRRITAARVALVDRHCSPMHTLIDVGIGCGDFIDACNQNALGFDINPVAVKWLEARGIFADPRQHSVHALTLFDAFEHIADIDRMLANAKQWVFVTIPIVPGDGPPRPDWRHWRVSEHCWYFTRKGFIDYMAAQGFECVEHCTMESLLGRLDSDTFAFKRVRPC